MSGEKQFTSWEDSVEWLRKQPDQQDIVKAAYYDDPLLQAAQRYWESDEWQEVSSFLKGYSGRALDVGAGRGIASYALSRDGFKVDALEPDPGKIVGSSAIRQLASESGFAINVTQDFSERLPYDDGFFDVVFARAVLHHMQNMEKVCKEVFRVLKPGGLFVAVREHVITKHEDLTAFFEIHPLHNQYGGENAHMLYEYINALKKAGFEIRSVLKPLASPINYFPHTRNTLRKEMLVRLGHIPLARMLANMLFSNPSYFGGVLKLLSMVDNRPGRLYSFICDKQKAK